MTPAGIHWFPGVGFRPSVWTPPHRDDEVDPPRLIVAPDADVALIAKVPPALAPVEPYGHLGNWGTVLPPVTVAQPSAAELAGPVATAPWYPVAAAPFTAGPLVPGPWWPPVDYPCRCITTPPAPDLPPMAAVPVAASGLMLAAGILVFMLVRLLK